MLRHYVHVAACLLAAIFSTALATYAVAAEKDDRSKGEYFEKYVRPILVER